MKYNQLQTTSNKARKRVGRGTSSGFGKTAGRGTKGQGSRSGRKPSAIFQGGQRALVQAVPKARGFKSIRTPAQVVYMDHLNSFDGKVVDNLILFEQGYIATPYHAVKVIGRGELEAKVTLRVQAASKSVVAAIEKTGGKFEKTATPLPAPSQKKTDSK